MTSTSTARVELRAGDEWLFSKEVATLLGMAYRYFTEEFIFISTDLPKPYRFTATGRRRWLRSEIETWLATRREAA